MTHNVADVTDAEIITAIKSGDTDLFIELLKRHEDYLCAISSQKLLTERPATLSTTHQKTPKASFPKSP